MLKYNIGNVQVYTRTLALENYAELLLDDLESIWNERLCPNGSTVPEFTWRNSENSQEVCRP
jgi:hypothetical protein